MSLAPPPPNENQHISNLAMTKSRIFLPFSQKPFFITTVHLQFQASLTGFSRELEQRHLSWATDYLTVSLLRPTFKSLSHSCIKEKQKIENPQSKQII